MTKEELFAEVDAQLAALSQLIQNRENSTNPEIITTLFWLKSAHYSLSRIRTLAIKEFETKDSKKEKKQKEGQPIDRVQ